MPLLQLDTQRLSCYLPVRSWPCHCAERPSHLLPLLCVHGPADGWPRSAKPCHGLAFPCLADGWHRSAIPCFALAIPCLAELCRRISMLYHCLSWRCVALPWPFNALPTPICASPRHRCYAFATHPNVVLCLCFAPPCAALPWRRLALPCHGVVWNGHAIAVLLPAISATPLLGLSAPCRCCSMRAPTGGLFGNEFVGKPSFAGVPPLTETMELPVVQPLLEQIIAGDLHLFLVRQYWRGEDDREFDD